jgi:hypothetical protein
MEKFDRYTEKGMVTAPMTRQQEVAAALSYTVPQLVVIGKTVALVQGPKWADKYKDYRDSGYNSLYDGY